MTAIITCKNLSKSFGAQQLFKEVNLVVHAGDRLGIIGPNGSGKSTLLKIICGKEESDSGTIQQVKHTRVGYLPQNDIFIEDKTVFDNLLLSLHDSVLDEQEKHNRVQEMISRGQFTRADQPVQELSGGWRKRLALCRVLLVHPTVLVMDEPTNHLDLEGILWLEGFITSPMPWGQISMVLVSHDRQFLENTVDRVMELNNVYPEGTFTVAGNYSKFLQRRSQYLAQQTQLEGKLATKVRRETEWLRRGPKARTSKARYRIDEAYRLQDELHEVKSRNRQAASVGIDFDGTGRKTKKLLEAKQIGWQYGERCLFSRVDMVLSPGSRLGLLGNNGSGKSTLMAMLAAARVKKEEGGSGEIRAADNVKIVLFEQRRDSLDLSLSLKRCLAPEGDSIVFRGRSIHVVSWAKRFLFRPDQLETPVSELSGGERARILIANLMRQPADILLLDEPTNDLDIASLDVFEESLKDFPGAVVLVTHDRYMLGNICDRVLGFDGQGGTEYFADADQWLASLALRQNGGLSRDETKEKDQRAKRKKERSTKGKLSYLDQREYDTMEERILEAEEKIESLQQLIDDPETAANSVRLAEIWGQLEKIQTEVEKLYERWDELEQKKAGLVAAATYRGAKV